MMYYLQLLSFRCLSQYKYNGLRSITYLPYRIINYNFGNTSYVRCICTKNDNNPDNISKLKNTYATQNKSRIFSRFYINTPNSIRPYLELLRLNKPSGTWVILWPGTWGIASAADPGALPDVYLLCLFAIGSLVMRGAGCTVNDIIDRDLDALVRRTANRPLVNGQITISQAWLFLIAQLACALTIALQLNWYSVCLSSCSLIPTFMYPFMKRITNWPQITLGITLNWGILLGYAAVKSNLDVYVCLPLYIAGICWTIYYDTIYAHQDKRDDLKTGIKSTALYFGSNTKYFLTGICTSMILNLIVYGAMNDQTWPYYASLILISSQFASQIASLDINNPYDCSRKFISNPRVGSFLFCGIVFGNLLKI